MSVTRRPRARATSRTLPQALSLSRTSRASRASRSHVAAWILALGAVWASGACGARTGLKIPPPAPECFTDADCPGVEDLCKPVYCQLFSSLVAQVEGDGDGTAGGLPDGGVIAPPGGTCKTLPEVECDDNDECTSDQCDTYTGQCIYGVVTLDLDGDGYRGPRVGTLAGEPGSCGDDCNDAN